VVRRSFSLPILLEIINLIIDIAGAVFLGLALFTVGENYLAFFSSDLISVLSFFWRLRIIAALIESFNWWSGLSEIYF
jgi:hypothetical protein